MLGRPVMPLQLVDPRYYHLDTALAVLDARHHRLPAGGLLAPSRELLAARFPDAVIADAGGRGGARPERGQRRPARGAARRRPRGWPRMIAERGFEPVPVDLSELLKAGGGVEVLHVGGTGMTIVSETRDRLAPAAGRASTTAHNYHPLPVVVAHAEGAWVTDVEGRRYLDCLAGYSALNFGHRHPALIAAAHRQLDRVTLTSRAFGNDQFGPFCAELAELLRQGARCCR